MHTTQTIGHMTLHMSSRMEIITNTIYFYKTLT